MAPSCPPIHPRHRAPRRQRGVYALEWAIIFPVFFALLYAIVCYGLTFLVRESMQYAVEEGARAALRYPGVAALNGATTPTWTHRSTEARNTAANALGWLPAALRPAAGDIAFTVCRVGDTGCNQQTALNPTQICDVATPCLVLVSYQINNYQNGAIAPAIPGLGLVLPATLQARASILVNGRVL
jgi:Flp pilus assembly protein TadG